MPHLDCALEIANHTICTRGEQCGKRRSARGVERGLISRMGPVVSIVENVFHNFNLAQKGVNAVIMNLLSAPERGIQREKADGNF